MNIWPESIEKQRYANRPEHVVGIYSFEINTNVFGSFFHFL